jgi:hypothetical protein
VRPIRGFEQRSSRGVMWLQSFVISVVAHNKINSLLPSLCTRAHNLLGCGFLVMGERNRMQHPVFSYYQ